LTKRKSDKFGQSGYIQIFKTATRKTLYPYEIKLMEIHANPGRLK